MENSPSQVQSPLFNRPVVFSDSPPLFSMQRVWLTKQEHIQLKWDAAFWKSKHSQSVEREQALKRELERSQKEISEREQALKKELEQAQGEIRDLRQRLYGRGSERGVSRNNKEFIGPKSSRKRGQQKGAKGHGKTQRPELPTKEIELDFPDGDACCSTCNKPFVPISKTENSDFIEIEVKAYTRRIKRKCYRPGCQCENLPGIITAPMPPRLFPRNTLHTSVWADVLLDKYLYARPTYRLLQHYDTLGLPVSQGTITDGLKRLEPMFEPLVEAMHAKQMTESLFWGDETRWMVFETVEGKKGYRWYLWIMISESVIFYRVATGRGADVPKDHFGSLDETIETAILICDRYSAYKKMAKEMPIFILAFCWAHVRRDYIDAARRFPEQQGWMFDWVEKIRELYQINKDRLVVWDKEKPLQQQSKLFSEQQKKLVKALSLMEQQRDEYLRNEELPAPQKAVLSSLKNHWPGLIVFVDHPQVSMDNNVSERGVRKGVNGRKNYYGSGSQWSADLMAGMLTLLQTILHWGINPRHWMTLFLSACAENNSNTPSDLSPFLPWEMDEKRKELLSRPIPNDTS